MGRKNADRQSSGLLKEARERERRSALNRGNVNHGCCLPRLPVQLGQEETTGCQGVLKGHSREAYEGRYQGRSEGRGFVSDLALNLSSVPSLSCGFGHVTLQSPLAHP